MIAYIVSKGKEVYKTNLNKLLFYSDFVNFYSNGKSHPGATYVHLPDGPVPEHYESMLTNLASAGTFEFVKGRTFELIRENSIGPL